MNVLDNLNAWRAVSAAARTGSVTAAAEQLGIELSKCSRLVSGMEREMGFTFFDKSTRPYRPTPQLRAFLAAFEPALRNLENARALHQATSEKMRIRFAAPIEISRLYFSKMLVSYAQAHPNLSFVLQPEGTLADLRAGAVDAIILSEVPAVAVDLVVRLYHATSTCVLATPAYLKRHGTPRIPADLACHTGLLLRTVNLKLVSRLYRDGVESKILEWKNVFITHDQIALKELLLDDRGIAVDLSLAHVVDELESGRIVPVMPGWERAPWRMCVVTLREREEACPPLRVFAQDIALKTGEDWTAYTERGRAAVARALRL